MEYRWNLIPDGEGKMRLIDANPILSETEPFFNAEADMAFLLFTRFNPTVGQRLTWTANSIINSNFNPIHPVRVIVHGFNSGPNNSVSIAPTAAYLQRNNYNVIV